ncbi:hypothetical protein [Frankia sp. R43]|uniref:hypothetical protein n=1 Tax=Frankia sp. R43 TaxID=269536 RepID=UPI000B1A1D32|nr:hypothetical protein [Frankia sp. R43]
MNSLVSDICQAFDASDSDALRCRAANFLECLLDGSAEYRPSRHPLGFVCISLLRDNHSGLCLHLWPEAPDGKKVSTVHSHSWDLRSFVLTGSLVNRVHRIDRIDRGAEALQRVFEVASDGLSDVVTQTVDFVTECVVEERRVDGGTFYLLPAGVFHTSEPCGPSVAATVVSGHRRGDFKDCFLGPADMAPGILRRSPCDATEVMRVVHASLSAGTY